MDFWVKAAQLLLSLSLLIVLHEFGHYIPARWFKTRVEKFYLFFDYKFSLFKKKIGETEWGIGWIPLGGYVKISGMIDESMDKDQMAKPPQPWEFRSKPAWQRLIIMIGGVVVNIIVGMLIYIMVLFVWGEQQAPAKDFKHGMAIQPYLEQYGVYSGDLILEIDGEEVMSPRDISLGLVVRGKRTLTVKHADGTVEDIELPEDIDYKLFEEGATDVANFRRIPTRIENVFATRDTKNASFKSGDYILKVDGTPIETFDISNPEIRSKGHQVTVERNGEEKTISATKEEFQSLLRVAPAFASGIKTNDSIVSINGTPIDYFDVINSKLYNAKNKSIALEIYRDGEIIPLEAKVTSKGQLGFVGGWVPCSDTSVIYTQHYSFGESIGNGIALGYQTLGDYAGQMKFLFTKKGATGVGGFGAIGNMFPATWDWQQFWLNTAFLSIVLAFMNILPIPALDGGHVMFLIYEIITGKEAPEKVLEIAQYIGFFLIIGLVLYANGNDLFRWLFG